MSNDIKSNTLLDDITSGTLLKYIEQILTIEESETKIGKFDIYSFVSKDKLRPAMQGIYHKDGYKFATNAHLLIKVKSNYDEKLEKHLLFKDGKTDSEIRVPNYDCVIPKYYEREEIDIDFSITKYDAEVKAHKKLYGKNALSILKHPDGNYYTYDFYVKCLSACKANGVTKMYIARNQKRILLFHNDVCDIILTQYNAPEDITDKEKYPYIKIFEI